MQKEQVNTVSDLLELALSDLKNCAASGKYTINMDVYFRRDKSGAELCQVCFAGSVMAGSLAAESLGENFLVPEDFSAVTIGRFNAHHALTALNELRLGFISVAARTLKLDPEPYKKFNRWLPDYSVPEAFIASVEQLITDLRAKGL